MVDIDFQRLFLTNASTTARYPIRVHSLFRPAVAVMQWEPTFIVVLSFVPF